MNSRSKNPRRGFGELVSELVAFAAKGKELADTWRGGENSVENVATAIRKIAGFGGKGFRTSVEGKNKGQSSTRRRFRTLKITFFLPAQV